MKIPKDPSLIHTVANEIEQMFGWSRDLDEKYNQSSGGGFLNLKILSELMKIKII